MRRIQYSPAAQRDLLKAWKRIAMHNLDAADRFRDNMYLQVSKLAEMPGIGHLRRDVSNPAYRFCAVKPYVIAFRNDESSLTVVRIIHGSRNFRNIFRPRKGE